MSRSRDVRALILEEATRQFAAKGFDGTSLQAIADEVDITKPSLLYHYSSKAELREQVLEELLSHWNSVLPRVLQAATSGDDQFEGLIEAVISFFSEDPDRARLLIREMMDRPDRMRGLLDEYLSPWMSILSDYIAKGKKEGTVYPDLDPTAYIANVIHLVVGGIATSDVFETLIEDESEEGEVSSVHIDEIVRLAGAGLFVDGERGEGERDHDQENDHDHENESDHDHDHENESDHVSDHDQEDDHDQENDHDQEDGGGSRPDADAQ